MKDLKTVRIANQCINWAGDCADAIGIGFLPMIIFILLSTILIIISPIELLYKVIVR